MCMLELLSLNTDWLMSSTLLLAFIPTFFFVSITPGMCMTLALSLGMSIGYRRTLWMMMGEIVGVAFVSIAAVLGMASIMLNYPWLFTGFKTIGAIYLGYIGIQMWRSKRSPPLSNIPISDSVFRLRCVFSFSLDPPHRGPNPICWPWQRRCQCHQCSFFPTCLRHA